MNWQTAVLAHKTGKEMPLPKRCALSENIRSLTIPQMPDHTVCTAMTPSTYFGLKDFMQTMNIPGKTPQNATRLRNAAIHPPLFCQWASGSNAEGTDGMA
jgi:hypothetical protein